MNVLTACLILSLASLNPSIPPHAFGVTLDASRVTCPVSCVPRHASLVTRHTSHVTRHASRVTLPSSPCDSIPALNLQVIALVRQQIGTTVGRGECWDLAAMALNRNGAKWDGKYAYGRKVDPFRECIYPGDIIQFEGVKVRYTRNQAVYTETMAHHTAVVNEVKQEGVFVLAHQNTGTTGRKVGLSDLDLKTVIKGKYQFYRPVW